MASPLPPRRLGPVRALNPAAGDHLVTAEPRELEAARRAGAAAQARWPYLAARYGERGGGFTLSDGAWIVTLVERSPVARREQVDWLAKVLGARGMPRRVLEVYLSSLADALTGAWPERADEYRGLAEEGARLAVERRAVLSDATLDVVDRTFAARAGSGPFDPRGTGELVAAAVADGARGEPGTLPAVEGWLADEARFPPSWVLAVRDAAASARAALKVPPP